MVAAVDALDSVVVEVDSVDVCFGVLTPRVQRLQRAADVACRTPAPQEPQRARGDQLHAHVRGLQLDRVTSGASEFSTLSAESSRCSAASCSSARPMPVFSFSSPNCIVTIPISANATIPIHARPWISRSSAVGRDGNEPG